MGGALHPPSALRVPPWSRARRPRRRLRAPRRGAVLVARVREVFARLRGSLVERLQVSRLGQEAAARDELLRRSAEERAALADERAAIEEAARTRDEAHAADIAEHRRLISGLQQEIVRLGTLQEGDRK